MKVRIKRRPSGLYNGKPWPAVGEYIDLPVEAATTMAADGTIEAVILADGGTIAHAGSVVVGSAGPEPLSLPQGARVDPPTGPGPETATGATGDTETATPPTGDTETATPDETPAETAAPAETTETATTARRPRTKKA